MKDMTQHRIRLNGRVIECRLVQSKAARKLRLRVGPEGVEVVYPANRRGDAADFLIANGNWVLDQLDRVDRLGSLRLPINRSGGQILFRGETTCVRVAVTKSRMAGNLVSIEDGTIVVSRGPYSRTHVARSLELWLRRAARKQINAHLLRITGYLGRYPRRIYVMDQRTKWGNCSSRGNLSFNWRLILAPDYVLQYLVTHEAVHLAIPDHSGKFWLTVQSLCRDMDRARHWLSKHQAELQVDLVKVLEGAPNGGRLTTEWN